MASTTIIPPARAQVVVEGPAVYGMDEVLTTPVVDFLKALHLRFNHTRKELLKERELAQQKIDAGELPGFLPETENIRNGHWEINPVPPGLQDRRVEITGPVECKMIINALNSGAKMFMADFEDSNTPSWVNIIQGQINLKAAVRKTIRLVTAEKSYQLNDEIATLLIRPRGWHMEEKHFTINGEPISASLFDFGVYFFHNAEELLQRGTGPYFYLPKTESYKEARLWNAVFDFAENYISIPAASIKATVLIETIPAVFQLNEILYELRTHAAGLNCGRWDYIFSFIKKFKNVPGYIFPDRSQITMTVPFMRDYTQLVVQTCHRRKAHAIGGMAAQIPIKHNEDANRKALEKVSADKIREVKDGHDGTWVAHPGLVPVAMEVFNKYMPQPNQIDNKRPDFVTNEIRLLALPEGTITAEGLRMNINIGILYIESWLRGNGAAAIYNLMEDAATAEISRTQVWQWLHCKAVMEDGREINQELYETVRDEEIENIRQTIGSEVYQKGKFPTAIQIFNRLVVQKEYEAFFTINAYNDIV
ncbi:malate synthase [Chitinophaga niastensis]|uniref:malate synthase n=1 Tax=Chitinophaga niastensis TaxID=536980 RepID=A0A2P8HER6_CHINA|nr:malate synthase A [Chitinophaga niastensis]PSL44716.1 malate synthase [Chitinophaga niastensis]